MKTKILKFALPIVMGLTLLIITIFIGCEDEAVESKLHCTTSAYPLWCPIAKVCCPRGHAYYCDGNCHEGGCPPGTVTMDDCRPG
ncbi:hypothetical protein ACFLSV_06925 [Bacteroidota bacterium]